MLKYFIIVLFITTSLAQPLNNKNKKAQNLKPNNVEIWENETKKIKDPELKKELMKLNEEFKQIYSNLTRWQKVELARHPDRPHTKDYIKLICDDWI